MSKRLLLVLPLAAALAACGGESASKAVLRIAVVPKGTTHVFWQSIHAGAIQAQRELDGVEIVWRGAQREDDRQEQVSLIDDFVASGISAIVIAPMDDRALVQPVRAATAAGIPVAVIDSGLQAEVGRDFVSFLATDNEKGGRIAGAELARLIGGKGRVLLLRYLEGSASTAEREAGFRAAIAEHAGIELIDPGRYAGATRESAMAASENLLEVHGELAGVFCPNESAVYGMLLALRDKGLAGKVRFVGFDASPGLVEALDADEIDALVVQDPMKMGYLGVKTVVAALRGETPPRRVDTGCVLATRANRNEEAVSSVLSPDLSRWLDE